MDMYTWKAYWIQHLAGIGNDLHRYLNKSSKVCYGKKNTEHKFLDPRDLLMLEFFEMCLYLSPTLSNGVVFMTSQFHPFGCLYLMIYTLFTCFIYLFFSFFSHFKTANIYLISKFESLFHFKIWIRFTKI